MLQKRIIAVVGSTGAQGNGLVRAILGDKKTQFAVRALTRKVDSEKARALADLGAEVVFADIDNAKSLEKAFKGAYGVFCVTPFWEHMSPEREKKQAENMAAAAKKAGVKHVVWSTLEDTRQWIPLTDNRMPTLMGKYKVPHFDAKAEMDQLFIDLELPVTFLRTTFYWDNLIFFGMAPQMGEKGVYEFILPMGTKKLPGIAAEDIGKCVYGIFKAGEALIGQTVPIAGEHLSGREMASILTRILGKPVKHRNVSPADYRKFGFPGAEDMGNMFQFYQEFNKDFRASRDVETTRKLNPKLLTFEKWLRSHKAQIPLN